KLRLRGEAMVRDIADVDMAAASHALDAAGQDIKQAVLVAMGVATNEAHRLLEIHGENLSDAMRAVQRGG
ncbi:MAG: N-acetylmuramic acid 6-phosphate etherase, partial [Sphingopyxis macrogoltabida]